LRVQRNFAGSIDTLKPAGCPREGDPSEPTVTVETVESGLRPVGDRNAEYRLWRVTCATGGAHEHRVWLLPTSKIAIYEQTLDALHLRRGLELAGPRERRHDPRRTRDAGAARAAHADHAEASRRLADDLVVRRREDPRRVRCRDGRRGAPDLRVRRPAGLWVR